MASQPSPRATPGNSAEAASQRLPAGTNAGLWAFLRQAAVIAGASALAGALAVLMFAQLQGVL